MKYMFLSNPYKDENCMSCMYNYYEHNYDTGKKMWKCRLKNKRRKPERRACRNFKEKYPYFKK